MAPREKSLGAVVVSSLVEILARSAPRSERDPDLEATTAKLAMHPVTGTFADPALELAFAAQLFRTAYPFHAFLMALLARISSRNQDLKQEQATALRGLGRGTCLRGFWFLAFIFTWTPLLFGQNLPLIPPAILVLFYILADQIFRPLLQSRSKQA